MTPRVSVIIPTIGRQTLLADALASVKAQTFGDFEVLVVCDQPLRRDAVAVQLGGLDDPRFRLVAHDRNLGESAARNTGIAHARGEIIAFLDDDDVWSPQMLDRITAVHAAHPKAGLVFTSVRFVWEGLRRQRIYRARLPEEGMAEAMRRRGFCPPSTSCVSVKRQSLEQCGVFDTTLVSFQDWDLWYRIARRFDVACVDAVLVTYNQHGGERSSIALPVRMAGLEHLTAKWRSELPLPEFRDDYEKAALFLNCVTAGLLGRRRDIARLALRHVELIRNARDLRVLLKMVVAFITAGPVFRWLYEAPWLARLRGRAGMIRT